MQTKMLTDNRPCVSYKLPWTHWFMGTKTLKIWMYHYENTNSLLLCTRLKTASTHTDFITAVLLPSYNYTHQLRKIWLRCSTDVVLNSKTKRHTSHHEDFPLSLYSIYLHKWCAHYFLEILWNIIEIIQNFCCLKHLLCKSRTCMEVLMAAAIYYIRAQRFLAIWDLSL